MSEPVIRCRDFSAWYAKESEPVLKSINLDIDANGLVLIAGAGGAGKSTFGLSLIGIIPHVMGDTSGLLAVSGKDVREADVAETAFGVGMIFQDIESMLCMLYVEDEVSFGPENLILPVDDVRKRVREALEIVNMSGFERRMGFAMSGGQKQRVAIATVLAMRPPVLFMDEPMANLDPRSSREVLELVVRLKEEHTVLLFDNKVDDVCHLADRLVVFDQGQIVADDSPREVLRTHGRHLRYPDAEVVDETAVFMNGFGGTSLTTVPLTIDEAAGVWQEAFAGPNGSAGDQVTAPIPAEPEVAEVAENVIEVDNVSYRYKNTEIPAVDDVSFNIHRGELVALLGPNGSGKTTLSKLIVGLFPPEQGRVTVDGLDTQKTTMRELIERIGFVFQNPDHQFVKDTVWEEVSYSLVMRGASEEEIEQEAERELELFGLAHLRDRLVSSLSGGEKRRLSVATILISRPDVLVLDEPTYGQDRANTRRMMDALFRAVAGEGNPPTIILVTHDMKLVAEYAQRALVMREGRLVFDGAVEQLFERDDLEEWVNLEDPPILRLVRSLRQSGLALDPPPKTPREFAAAYARLRRADGDHAPAAQQATLEP